MHGPTLRTPRITGQRPETKPGGLRPGRWVCRRMHCAGAQPRPPGLPRKAVTSASFPEGPAQGRDPQAEPLWPGLLDSRRRRDRRAELFYWVAWLQASWAAGASAVEVVGLDVGGDLGLPLVPVAQQLLLVVQELLVRLSGELEVGALRAGAGAAASSPPHPRPGAHLPPAPPPPCPTPTGQLTSTMASTGQASWQKPQ